MEGVRRFHNQVKKELVQECVQTGDRVLDVGCGCGGDVHKWKQLSVHVDMCDPDHTSLEEAKSRSQGWSKFRFFTGDIFVCPQKKYNVICYNFSIQYIFETRELLEKSIRAIQDRLAPGGLLVGTVPNSDMVLMNPNFKDQFGNFMVRKNTTGNGTPGEKVYVYLSDTPFYKSGPKKEPIAYKDLLVNELLKYNIHLLAWRPFYPMYELSKMYSCFIFKRI